MTESSNEHVSDNTRTDQGATPGRREDLAEGVRGGNAERMDSPGAGTGGVPAAGADGVTGEREQMRKDLGERSQEMGEDTSDPRAAAPLGGTDSPANAGIGQPSRPPADPAGPLAAPDSTAD